MPAFVKTKKDEKIWSQAKDQFKKQYGHHPEKDYEWAIANEIYQRMHPSIESLINEALKTLNFYDTCSKAEWFKILNDSNSDRLKKIYSLLTDEKRKKEVKDQLKNRWDEILEESYINNTPLVVLDKWDDEKEEYEKNLTNLKYWVMEVNEYAVTPFKTTNYDWFSKYVVKHQDDPIWKNLSNDKSALEHFKINEIDPSEIIVCVNSDFLFKNRGNAYSDEKTKRVDDMLNKGMKFELPIFIMRDGTVGEGNHRIKALIAKGYNAIPVYIQWK